MNNMVEELRSVPHIATIGKSRCGMTVMKVRYDDYVNGFKLHVYRIDQDFNTIAQENTEEKLDYRLKLDRYQIDWYNGPNRYEIVYKI